MENRENVGKEAKKEVLIIIPAFTADWWFAPGYATFGIHLPGDACRKLGRNA